MALHRTVSHRRKQARQVREPLVSAPDGAHRIGARIDQFLCPVLASGNDARAIRHFTVCKCGTVLYYEHPFALNLLRSSYGNAAGGLQNDGGGVVPADIVANNLNIS